MDTENESNQANRTISTGKLHALLRFHTRPINLVVFEGPSGALRPGDASSQGGLPAYMLSAVIPSVLSYPALRLATQPEHQRYVRPGPLVLGSAPLKSPTPTADRDRTVSRRSEPSSRATLIGEQPNPWDLLQPQDVTSRHRGAKPPRRCELLGVISLLSPEYLLSDERWPFHSVPPDHYDLLSHLLDLSVSQLSTLSLLHATRDFRPR